MFIIICLLFLSFNESPIDIQSLSFPFVVCMSVLLFDSIVNKTFMLKLFDMFYRLVFYSRGRSPRTLIIRYWSLLG